MARSRSWSGGRSYDIPPGLLEETDERWLGKDPRYASIESGKFPQSEALKQTVERVVPYFQTEIMAKLAAGKRLLIAAHGNSLRALVKYLDAISDADIIKYNIPTGIPLVYELDDNARPIKNYYLGDADAIKAAQEAVANQGKAK
jgi:2,3-bisphosphoglycerate-dependent phosphoglycerate mutase